MKIVRYTLSVSVEYPIDAMLTVASGFKRVADVVDALLRFLLVLGH
jgi:hypothetical protein